MSAPRLGLRFGALCPSLLEQLHEAGVGADPTEILSWQKDADAICRLLVKGMLTSAAAHRARKLLLARIAKGVTPRG